MKINIPFNFYFLFLISVAYNDYNASATPRCKNRIANSNNIRQSHGTSTSKPSASLVSPDELASARYLPADSRNDDLPPWLNVTLARLGQRFARSNLIGGLFAAVFGLMASIAIPDNKNVLLFSGNSDTPDKVLIRYAATAVQTLVWYQDDLQIDKAPNSAFLTSLSHVRQLHASHAKSASEHGLPLLNSKNYEHIPIDDELWNALKADLLDSRIPEVYHNYSATYFKYDINPIPINQFTIATTQFAFFGHLLLNPSSVFVHYASDENLMGMVHLWAIIGYMMGLEDQFNICLQPNLKTARKYFQQVFNNYYLPALFNLDHTAKVLLEALVHGYNDFLPIISARVVVYRYLRDIIRIPVRHMNSILSFSEKISQLSFDVKFVPGMRIPFLQILTDAAMLRGLDVTIATIFGPYFTYTEMAQNVFYNGTDGFLFRTVKEKCAS